MRGLHQGGAGRSGKNAATKQTAAGAVLHANNASFWFGP
jgi:hypothetical protein